MMIKQISYVIMIFLCVTTQFVGAQDIRINEVMASNSQTILDEDGDTPDWVELYNYGTESINLEGYGLSDNSSSDSFWIFPSFELAPEQYLVVFASDKDRKDIPLQWETVIDLGDEWRYTVPESDLDDSWKNIGFDDSSWQSGKTSIGYGDDDDSTIVENVLSIFLRKTFTVDGIEELSEIMLHIDYDDGFVAFLNGTEIARSGLSGQPPAFDETAISHESVMHSGGQPESFNLGNASQFLNEGENVLSVQVHNTSSSSSDMTIIPILSFGSTVGREGDFSAYLSLSQASFHSDFKVSSGGDSVFLRNASLEMIDTLVTGELSADISIGISQEDPNRVVFFEEATPGEVNSANGYDSISGAVDFTTPGGLYVEPVEVNLTTEAGGEILYTLDGSIPSIESPVYTSAIVVSSNTVISARVITENSLPGKVSAASYLIGVNHDIPIVSIAVDPYDFFDENDGMYMLGPNAESDFPYFGANFWEDRELPIHVEMYEPDGSLAFSVNAGAKIFGNYSRGNNQRSLSLFFRKSYGDGPIKYKIFPDKDLEEFSSIVLRNSGNDWNNTMMRDGLLTSLFHDSIDHQGYRPAVVYINGEYWGIQNIREKINEHFLANNHDLDSDSVEILESEGSPIYGNEEHYVNLIDFVEDNDLSIETNYEYVKTQMDVMNFIYYMTGNIFINNQDWPGNNIKYWRENREGGKWRWIAFDTDFGFGIWNSGDYVDNTLAFALEEFGTGWPNPSWSTLLLRSLIENETFKKLFVNAFADQLNSTWRPEAVKKSVDAKKELIANEIAGHMNRWNGNLGSWNQQVDSYYNYADNRPEYMYSQVINELNLGGDYTLTVNVSGETHGDVRINIVSPQEYPWQGIYFNQIPIELQAIPKPGYRFVRWSGALVSTEETLSISFSSDESIQAIFEEIEGSLNDIVINEINYNSEDIEDWVELFNKTEEPVDVSNWVLRDNDDTHEFTFPEGTSIAANDFLVVCRDKENFLANYPTAAVTSIGDMSFGLSSSGDCIRLEDSQGSAAEEVCYQTTFPWPEGGSGETLALKNPYFDNDDASSWYNLGGNGNPGQPNITDEITGIDIEAAFTGLSIYPNPSDHIVNIRYNVKEPGTIDLSVFDLNGKKVDEIYNGKKEAGQYSVQWLPNRIELSGIYLVKLVGAEGVTVNRVVLK